MDKSQKEFSKSRVFQNYFFPVMWHLKTHNTILYIGCNTYIQSKSVNTCRGEINTNFSIVITLGQKGNKKELVSTRGASTI